MKYRVVLQPRAKRQLDEQYEYIARRSPRAAVKWFNGFTSALIGLSVNPHRFAVARESEFFGREMRQLLFGRRAGIRRAIYVIDEGTVRVLTIRHAAQSDAPQEDLLDG